MIMKMTRPTTILTVLLMGVLLSGCHDDDDNLVPDNGRWSVSVADVDEGDDTPMLAWQASYESLSVVINGRNDSRTVVVTSSDEWLTVASDTLAADGIVMLETTTNSEDRRRTATLRFTSADDPTLSAELQVTQLSRADNATNGGDARAQLYVCYGYDIYKELESPMSVRTKAPILDFEDLQSRSNDGVYQVITDCHMSRTEVKYVSTNSITSFGKDLTQQQTTDAEHPIEGCRQNCVDAADLVTDANGSLEQQNFGHGTLEKAVAARVIDRGALIDLQRRNELPYSTEFADILRKIRYTYKGDRRRQAIDQVLTNFGTHVIIEVDLGGRIDYTFAMSKESSFNSEEEMKQEIEYTLGRMSDNDRTTSNTTVSTKKSANGAISVKGGSDPTRITLEKDIKGLSASGQINPSHLTDWLASINYSDIPENDPALDVIHFELMPLWDLVPDDLRQDFLDATMEMVNRSDCKLPASFLGTDIYEFEPDDDAELFDFSYSDEETSLCRILYFDYDPKSNDTYTVTPASGDPVLEVCSEYVPNIRTDQRVTIVYPIYKQKIRLNQGLFLGDGVHQPAFVGFSGSQCYVNPIDSLKPGTIIKRFYYVNGNLALKNPTNVSGLYGKRRRIEDDVLTLYSSDRWGGVTHNHPIVKIGSQFWIRRDINHQMYFAERPSGSSLDQIWDDILYAKFQFAPNNEFVSYNGWTWGYKPNTFFEGNPNTSWYLPSPNEVRDLYTYIGFNPKALFRDQVSGFNAQFNGYYGSNDLKDENRYFDDDRDQVRYKGELNVIGSMNSDNYEDACLIVLDKDYTIKIIDDNTFTSSYFNLEWRMNSYPVRAVRGYMYNYPKFSEILDNLR